MIIDDIDEWVDGFLRNEGKNVELADGLKHKKRYWVGPVEVAVNKLVRCCGPEADMEYPEELESWNRRVDALVADGHVLTPLIVEYANGKLLVRDGNHRHGALEKLGVGAYQSLIWCNTEQEVDEIYEYIKA